MTHLVLCSLELRNLDARIDRYATELAEFECIQRGYPISEQVTLQHKIV